MMRTRVLRDIAAKRGGTRISQAMLSDEAPENGSRGEG